MIGSMLKYREYSHIIFADLKLKYKYYGRESWSLRNDKWQSEWVSEWLSERLIDWKKKLREEGERDGRRKKEREKRSKNDKRSK
jgi:hypothetical protein